MAKNVIIKNGVLQVSGGPQTTYTSVTQTGNTAATITDVFSHTIDANRLNATGESLVFRAAGTFAATGSANKQITAVLGATTIFDTGAMAQTAFNSWDLSIEIIRVDATTVKCITTMDTSYQVLSTFGAYTVATVTLTAPLTFKLTIFGTLANDVVSEFAKEVWYPAVS